MPRVQHQTESSDSASRKSRRAACKHCRQAKMRCDLSTGGVIPCSRCRRLDRECRIEMDFKRMNKPEKLDVLEKEIRELRSSLASIPAHGTQSIAQDEQAADTPDVLNLSGNKFESSQQLFSTASKVYSHEIPNLIGIDPGSHRRASAVSIDDIILEPDQVTKLFQIFFEKYHPHILILNPFTTPEEYFKKSKLLFWTINYVASRRHRDEPALFVSLIASVKKLLWDTISNPPYTLELLQSMILICMWPFPASSLSTDATINLATLAHSIALQLGFHRPEVISDFSRTHKQLNPSEISDCLKAWSACYIVMQRNSFIDGQPSLVSDWTIARLITQNNHRIVPKMILEQLQIYQFEVRSSSSIAGVPGFAEGSARPGDTLPLLALLEREFGELRASLGPELTVENSILLDGAGLHLYVYYLMERGGATARKTALLRGYSLATGLIKRVFEFETESDFIRYAPQVNSQVLSLAAMLILKLCFSSYSAFIDVEDGKCMFHAAAQMIRRTSLEDNDLQGRVSKILTQLWGGYAHIGNFEEEPSLKLRTRLAASLLHDILWTWRDAYGNVGNENIDAQGRVIAATSRANDIAQTRSAYNTIDNLNYDIPDLESMLNSDFLSLFSFSNDDHVLQS